MNDFPDNGQCPYLYWDIRLLTVNGHSSTSAQRFFEWVAPTPIPDPLGRRRQSVRQPRRQDHHHASPSAIRMCWLRDSGGPPNRPNTACVGRVIFCRVQGGETLCHWSMSALPAVAARSCAVLRSATLASVRIPAKASKIDTCRRSS